MQALRTGELCPAAWKPGDSTIKGHDEWLAKALPRLSKEVLLEAAENLQTVRFKAGEVVFKQGDTPDFFYIIASGEAEVRHGANREQQIIATLKPGDFFGEIGLLTEARRTAAVRAKTDLELLALDWDAFRKVVESSESTGADFAEIIRDRLATAFQKIFHMD